MSVKQASVEALELLAHAKGRAQHATKSSIFADKMIVHAAPIAVDPYFMDKGQLQVDSGVGVQSVSTTYADSTGITVAGQVTPAQAATGADYRFLPASAYISGNSTWFPVGKTVNDYPQLRRVSQTSKIDPVLQSTYYYMQHRPQVRVNTPAYCINDTGYFQIRTASTGNAFRTACTFLMVFVPHHGTGTSYPIYSCRRQAANGSLKRLEFLYVKGTIQMLVGGKKILTLPVYLNSYEPCIFGWSFDGTTMKATMFLYDRNAKVQTANVKGSYYWDFNADIGARTTTDGGSTIDWANSADMDILEIDLWNSVLSTVQRNAVIGLLKAVYNIGR